MYCYCWWCGSLTLDTIQVLHMATKVNVLLLLMTWQSLTLDTLQVLQLATKVNVLLLLMTCSLTFKNLTFKKAIHPWPALPCIWAQKVAKNCKDLVLGFSFNHFQNILFSSKYMPNFKECNKKCIFHHGKALPLKKLSNPDLAFRVGARSGISG